MLLVAGYKDDEIAKIELADLSNEELQQKVRERLLGTMVNNGSRQKVFPITEVKDFIMQGWEYVAQLPNGGMQ